MGITVSLPWSLRSTMGMLVTGSIISPLIFISTSIVSPPGARPFILPLQYGTQPVCGWLDDHLAQKAVRERLCDLHSDVVPDVWLWMLIDDKIERLVLRGAADELNTGRV